MKPRVLCLLATLFTLSLAACAHAQKFENPGPKKILQFRETSMQGASSFKDAEACPEQTYYQRYIDVPHDYRNPEGPRFKLYFELSAAFDASKPTVLRIRGGQQLEQAIGASDFYQRKWNLVENGKPLVNVVQINQRGLHCSLPIPRASKENPNYNWKYAYRVYDSFNYVMDIETVRQHLEDEGLIQAGRFFIQGRSGGGTLALQYLSRFSDRVSRSVITRSGKRWLQIKKGRGTPSEASFLVSKAVQEKLDRAIDTLGDRREVTRLIWILQRIGYTSDDYEADLVEILDESVRKRRPLFAKLTSKDEWGDVYSVAKHWQRTFPQGLIRMSEFFGLSPQQIGYRGYWEFEPALQPLIDLAREGQIRERPLTFTVDTVQTETLVLGGSKDHVTRGKKAAIELSNDLPNSHALVFDSTHMPTEEEKLCYRAATGIFLVYGYDSEKVSAELKALSCEVFDVE